VSIHISISPFSYYVGRYKADEGLFANEGREITCLVFKVSLISKKLAAVDCEVLLEKISGRIDSCLSKSLFICRKIAVVIFCFVQYSSLISLSCPRRLLDQLSTSSTNSCEMVMQIDKPNQRFLGNQFVFQRRKEGWG
jgi:hypothetical protein